MLPSKLKEITINSCGNVKKNIGEEEIFMSQFSLKITGTVPYDAGFEWFLSDQGEND